MFEQAVREKLRFDSVKGQLSVEDLWDLPLTSEKSASLNNVAIGIDQQLNQSAQKSFVAPAPTGNSVLELKLDIVKHVIAVKSEERDAAKVARANKELRQRILAVKADRADAKLLNSSDAELDAILDSMKA